MTRPSCSPDSTEVVRLREQLVALRARLAELERDVQAGGRPAGERPAGSEDWRHLFEMATDAILLADSNGRYIDANPKACELVGRTRGEILLLNITDLVAKQDQDRMPVQWERLRSGEPTLTSRRLVHADGSLVPVEISAREIPDGRFLAFIRDISQREKDRIALEEKEAHLRAVVDTEPECVKILDRNGGVVEMNPAGLAMIEADGIEAVRGKNVMGLILEPHREAFRNMVTAVFRGESGSCTFEIEGMRGTRRWLETVSVPLRPPGGGAVRSLLGLTRDITARRKAENELLESRRELATYHDLLTHDLANLSMTMLGLLERLLSEEEGVLGAAQKEMLLRANRQAFETNRLAENARLLGRLREGNIPFSEGEVRLLPLLRSAAETVVAIHFDRGVDIRIEGDEKLVASGFPLLDHVFLNLLDNAVRHSRQGVVPKIRARVEPLGGAFGGARVSVVGGRPPDPSFLPKVFQRYARGAQSSGSGLGLALVNELVTRGGGSVEARIADCEGEKFFEVVLELRV